MVTWFLTWFSDKSGQFLAPFLESNGPFWFISEFKRMIPISRQILRKIATMWKRFWRLKLKLKKIWIIKKMSPYCYTYMLNMLKIRLYFCFKSIQLNLCKMCFIIYSNHLTIFMLFYTNKCTCMHVLSIYIWLCVDIVIGKFVYDKTIQK